MNNLKQHKKLSKINEDYCREITLFFCAHFYQPAGKKEEFLHLVSTEIEKRLLHTGLIRNYKINYMDTEARRQIRLDSLLRDEIHSDCDVEVILEFGPGSYAVVEFK